MAYAKKTVAEAKRLYTVEGLSYEKTAKQLKIKKPHTIMDWAQNEKWAQKRHEIGIKSDQITEEILINELAINKAKIKKAGLDAAGRVLKVSNAFIMEAEQRFLDAAGRLKPGATDDPDFVKYFNLFRLMSPRVESSAKTQDDIAFNKNKIDITTNVKVEAAGLYKAAIEKAQSSLNIKHS